MVLICSIVGSDFEQKPELSFIVDRLKLNKSMITGTVRIYNWLRFEILKKDFDDAGTQYNNWSFRGSMTDLPRVTRPVPDFDYEWLPDNPDEDIWKIYKDTVREGGKKEK